MNEILRKTELAPKLLELVISAPRIAGKAKAGQFVVVMAGETGERIPLTIADFDRNQGTVTLVLMVVGATSLKLSRLEVRQGLYALIGPLGKPSEIDDMAAVVLVAGGVGAAPVYPIAREFHQAGTRVITIQGSRSKELLFWTDRLAAVSDQHIITTDDGTAGRKALVTEPLQELIEADAEKAIGCVYAIGPAIMMKFCAKTTAPFGVKTVTSLNPVMVDGTGMCGGCRVDVGGEVYFTCVDGPEFDGHLVNWDQLLSRQKIYHDQEACLLERVSRESER